MRKFNRTDNYKQIIPYTENEKWGFKDAETNEILIPALYEEVNPSEEKKCFGFPVVYDEVKVKLNGRWGVRSVGNEEILPSLYDKIESEDFGYSVKLGNKFAILNETGENITPAIYDEIDAHNNIIIVRINDKWGTLNNDGTEILPIIYDKIYTHPMTSYLQITLSGKVGAATSWGKILIPTEYDDVYLMESACNVFGVQKNGKWQLVDCRNRAKNSEIYDNIKTLFDNNVIAVQSNNKWGFVNYSGMKIYPVCVDEYIWDCSFLKIKINNKWGVLDTAMKEILPVAFDKVAIEDLGLQKCGTENALGIEDKYGNIIIPQNFQHIYSHSSVKIIGKKNGESDFEYTPKVYFEVSKNNKWGVYDNFGNEIIPIKYDFIKVSDYENSLFPAYFNGKWGYVNDKNETIIPFIYENAECFTGNFAEVQLDDKIGFIDRQGKITCPFDNYCWACSFDNDLVYAIKGDKRLFYDREGRLVDVYGE